MIALGGDKNVVKLGGGKIDIHKIAEAKEN